MKKYLNSRSIFFLLCALFLLNRFNTSWGPGYDNSRMIAWDTYGYYLYLPSIFIYHDPGFENKAWVDSLQNRYQPSTILYQVQEGEDGKRSIKYPCGSAILWTPFFFTAHLLAEPLGYPADGLSPPYSWALVIGGCFYAFIGLWFLRKVLLHFFNDGVASALLVLITLGTNYWSMAASETVMPHGNSFALNCVLLWLIIRWHQQPTFGKSVAIGIALGIGVLVRPTEIFWILVPVFWNVHSWKTLKEKLDLFWQQRGKLLAFIVVFTALISLQLIYWKYTMGTWVAYGYDEKFAIWSPFLYNCLFSFKKGWFIYTPLMMFCFAGFYFVWKRKREIFWALALFVVLHTWVIFSWECWWYAASFGQRGAIDMYAAMTIPLGFLLVAVFEKSLWLKVTITSLLGFCLALSVFQTWQYNHGIIHGERMTRAYYWSVFGETDPGEVDYGLLEVDRWPASEKITSEMELVVVDEYMFTFEGDSNYTNGKIVDSVAHTGFKSYLIDSAYDSGPMQDVVFYGGPEEYRWMRATVWMRMDSALRPGVSPPMLTVSYWTRDRALKWKAQQFDTSNYTPGEWRMVQCEIISPVSLYKTDHFSSVVWHPGKTNVYIDDFHVEILAPKNHTENK